MANNSCRDGVPQSATEERTALRLDILRLQAATDAYQRMVNSLPDNIRQQYFATPEIRAYATEREAVLADQERALSLLEQERESNAFLRQQNQELAKEIESYNDQLQQVHLLTEAVTMHKQRHAAAETERIAEGQPEPFPSSDDMAEELGRLQHNLTEEKATTARLVTNLRRKQEELCATKIELEEEKTHCTDLEIERKYWEDTHRAIKVELTELQSRYDKLRENHLQLKDDAQQLHRDLQAARDELDQTVKHKLQANPPEAAHIEKMLRDDLAHKELVVQTLNRRLQTEQLKARDTLALTENKLLDLRLQYAKMERESQELTALYAGAQTEVENLQRAISTTCQELAEAQKQGRFWSPELTKAEPQTPKALARATAPPQAANRVLATAQPKQAVKPDENKILTSEIIPETPEHDRTCKNTAELLLSVSDEPQPITITAANMPADYYGPELGVGSIYIPIIASPLKIKRGKIELVTEFTGSRNARQLPINRWIDRYETFCRKYALPPHECVAHLDEVLTGDAAKWYFEQSAILAHALGGCCWRTWRAKLLQEFTNQDLHEQRVKEFETLNYRDFDNLLDYAQRKWQLRQDVFGVEAHRHYPETWMIDHLYQLMGVIMRNQLKHTHFGGQPHSWSQLVSAIRIFFTNKAYREANDPCVIDRKPAPRQRTPKPQRDQPNMPLVSTAQAPPAAPASPATPPNGPTAVSRCQRCGGMDHSDDDCPGFKAGKLSCDNHLFPSKTHNRNMCRQDKAKMGTPQAAAPRPCRQQLAHVNFAEADSDKEEEEEEVAAESESTDSEEEDF
jgi:hypothetical protein